jgi:Skp family chaperone for outer membrane proteins
MKFRPTLALLAVLAIATIGYVTAVSAAEQATSSVPQHTDEQKVLLKALDEELNRFESLMAKVGDAKYAEFLKAQLQEFRKRRDAILKVAFDSTKYDELRYDLVVDYQRLAQWFMPSVPPRASK